jgi:hypothetical protein
LKCAHNSNRELTVYNLDKGRDPAEGLRVIREAMRRRQNVVTRQAYAWALFRNGEYREADEEIRAVLAIGARDEGMLAHAAAIRERFQSPHEIAGN